MADPVDLDALRDEARRIRESGVTPDSGDGLFDFSITLDAAAVEIETLRGKVARVEVVVEAWTGSRSIGYYGDVSAQLRAALDGDQ